MNRTRWRIRLSGYVDQDFAEILEYTLEQFGARQADIYENTLMDAITELAAGPNVAGSKSRDEIFPGLKTLHVARDGRRGRHFIMYRVIGDGEIEILRLLYDGMDLAAHVPPSAMR
jgi:toxin ParE1/3/4